MGTSIAKRTVAMSALVVALGTPAAMQAAQLVVPTLYGTIQEAVDAALPGDIVKVLPGMGPGDAGVYPENVVIEKSITLQCAGPAVIDVSSARTTRGAEPADFSSGITVLGPGGDGAVIEGCTVKFAQPCNAGTDPACTNSSDEGNGIRVAAENVVIRRCSLLANAASGLRLEGDGFSVSNTDANGNFGYGFFIGSYGLGSDNGSLLRNKARGNTASGIKIVGIGNVVDGNVVSASGSECLELDGDGNTISRNRVAVCGTDGINVAGEENTVRLNRAEDARENGMAVEGRSNRLSNNAVFGSGGHGFVVADSGSTALLERNVAQRNSGHGFALTLLPPADTETALVSGNNSRENVGDGFTIQNTARLVFRENRASLNGGRGVSETDSDFNLYDANRVDGNLGDGFLFEGAGGTTVVSNNRVIANLGDGIDLDRTATDAENGPITISGNFVQRNGGTGIENDKPGTLIDLNRATGNRTDIAGAGDQTPSVGTVGSFTGNIFSTGGATTSTPGTGPNDPPPPDNDPRP